LALNRRWKHVGLPPVTEPEKAFGDIDVCCRVKGRRHSRALVSLADEFNAHDLDRIMSHFAEDAALEKPRGRDPWGTRFVGKIAVREGLVGRFKGMPDVHYP
jgi:SnoaL-like domain